VENAPQWGVPLNAKQTGQLRGFGRNVQRERLGRGLTQEKLAELVELNIRTVQKIEAGDVNILLTTVLRLRSALKCPWESLLGKRGTDS
jgi:transcriptional regulator with XRE-family HTH domain